MRKFFSIYIYRFDEFGRGCRHFTCRLSYRKMKRLVAKSIKEGAHKIEIKITEGT